MSAIVVYTCLIGNRDELRRPGVVNPNVRYVCFSDRSRRCEPWEIQPAFMPLESPQRNSRIPKHLPHLFFPDADYSLWVDGQIGCNIDPEAMLRDWLRYTDLALYWHSCRRNVWEEAEFCKQYNYGDPREVDRQVAGYRREGMNAMNSRLWSGGVIARRHSPAVAGWNETLWRAYRIGSCRDQLAIPYAVWKTGIPVRTIGDADHILGPPGVNPWFPFYYHDENAKDSPEYARLQALCQT